MEKIGPYELDTITEEDILPEQLRSVIKKYEENNRLWKISLLIFLVSLAADYILGSFLGKNVEGGFNYTKPGEFLVILAFLFFILFVISLIRESRILKKQWVCPRCGRKLPYFLSKTNNTGRYGNKEILDDCYSRGIFLGKKPDSPFIVPGRCPECREQLTKEL